MHQYWGFGLNIESEIQFPELLPLSFDAADVTIRIGTAPERLIGKDVIAHSHLSISSTEYLLDVPAVAKYFVVDGNSITIPPYPTAEKNSIRLFMLSNAMAAILHQQKKIPFHASGIILNEELILFTGPSGIGKSTTLLGLMQKGYDLFTDDVCVLSQNETTGKIEAVPSYPMMKLWENTINYLSSHEIKRHQLRPNIGKYGVLQHNVFRTAKFPVKKVFLLNISTESTVDFAVHTLGNIEAFNALQQNAYRRDYIKMMQLNAVHFSIISKMAAQCEVLQIERPPTSTIAGFIDSLCMCL
jgi:hypothetical protein